MRLSCREERQQTARGCQPRRHTNPPRPPNWQPHVIRLPRRVPCVRGQRDPVPRATGTPGRRCEADACSAWRRTHAGARAPARELRQAAPRSRGRPARVGGRASTRAAGQDAAATRRGPAKRQPRAPYDDNAGRCAPCVRPRLERLERLRLLLLYALAVRAALEHAERHRLELAVSFTELRLQKRYVTRRHDLRAPSTRVCGPVCTDDVFRSSSRAPARPPRRERTAAHSQAAPRSTRARASPKALCEAGARVAAANVRLRGRGRLGSGGRPRRGVLWRGSRRIRAAAAGPARTGARRRRGA